MVRRMTRIEETTLPGVGTRFDLDTEDGYRIGIIRHRTGRREIFVSGPDDPDSCLVTVSLEEDEANALADLLGGSQVVRELVDLQQRVEGLAIDWLPLWAESPYAGRTIGDARIRTRTGVSVVAILRGGSAIPAPGPAEPIEAGDTLLVVGTPEGIEQLGEILESG
jgi:TrkA domain protein